MALFGRAALETVGAIADYDISSNSMRIHTNSVSFTSYLFMVANT